MQFETTIERPVEVSGVGLHSGVPVKLRMTPAPAGTGVVFRRPDLDYFTIQASWKHVARVSYATSLMRQGVLISTTEHLLSTLYSFGIDNVSLELDNLEVPIVDGSGKPFVDMLRTAGIRQLRRKRRYLRIRRPVTVEEGKKRISILPHDSFRLTCDIDFPQPIGKHSIEMEVTPENYASQLSPARTFGFEKELDQLREMGLIRGASLQNAVCFSAAGEVMNPEGLRFPDECCRHKALDLIGDLALIGKPLLGHVIAERAGHAMHTALVAKIMSDSSLYEIVTFDDLASRVAESLVLA
ncbi:MAG: UDP-3-O-[3-hydroxymyristoyl] N-acetylglucosamine deacetylase [Bryobacterales bacterium]|nr:UDP-3-O-[3-hydroxymyristoyl] N-acetylglucosamine deacetylase [Bryobacterales bacterium]